MSRSISIALLAVAAASLAVGGCGESDERVERAEFTPRFHPVPDARRGGELTVLTAGDVGPLDPGQVINQSSFMVSFATQRTLMAVSPRSSSGLIPDLLADRPEIDRDRGLIRMKIRDDVTFSPPVDRPVVADDVKYAMERALMPGVANGEVDTYFGSLAGFERARSLVESRPREAPDIAGIRVLGKHDLELRFDGPVPPLAESALTLAATAPVPREFAQPYDRSIPSDYGEHVVGTGPYMVERSKDGDLTGYEPGKSISIVRNPNWSPGSDFRPAFLDDVEIESGYSNLQMASNVILDGSAMVNGDFSPPPTTLKRAATDLPDQLALAPATATLYASLNTTVPPFDDLNVRRAVLAAVDRDAMRLAIGGEVAGHIATHFLPPAIRGFEEAGGVTGPGFDFLASPEGDPGLAADYMRKAGYPSGRYDGDARPTMVTDTTGQGRRFAEILRQALESIGIETDLATVSRDTMYSTYCNVPAKRVGTCPNVGWVGQFGDGQQMLDPTFNGAAILPVNNSNWPQLDQPRINEAIDRGKDVRGIGERARVWGRVDRMITAQAPAVPIVWRDVAYISSEDVDLVLERSSVAPALPMISLRGE